VTSAVLMAQPWRSQKNLTVMFTDISGFTKHTETISRSALMARLDEHNALLIPIVAHFEGTIVKTLGDAFLITFESPTDALRCALFMQHTLRQHNHDKRADQQIRIKISINSGEVTVSDGDIFGDPVNVTAKIEKATEPDEIYFTEAVFLAMNKAEVPCEFVKPFKPKGADGQEIKLYRVLLEEADARYQAIVQATRIDYEKVRPQVIELTQRAQQEYSRYRDALELLITRQSKWSRGLMVSILIAAIILGGAIIGGAAYYRSPVDDPLGRLMDGVRRNLASDKPQDAREQLLAHTKKYGASELTEQAMQEVLAHERNAAARAARKLGLEDQPAQAVSLLNIALKDAGPAPELQALMTRAQAHLDAIDALAAGDAARVRQKLSEAAGGEAMTAGMQKLNDQAAALDDAQKTTRDRAMLKEHSEQAIEKLALAFGDTTANPAVLSMLKVALQSRIYWAARAQSMDASLALLGRYRARFINVTDWGAIELERELGGLHLYGHRAWVVDAQAFDHRQRLATAARNNPPEFQYRLGVEMHEVETRSRYYGSTFAPMHISEAVERNPALLNANREQLSGFLKTWLRDAETDQSPARNMARKHFYTELRPWLQSNLTASKTPEENNPPFRLRGNCFALLAERGDLPALADPAGYFRENFVDTQYINVEEKNDPGRVFLTRRQARRFFDMPMSRQAYKELRRLLEKTHADFANRNPAAANTSPVLGMIEELNAAQPAFARETD